MDVEDYRLPTDLSTGGQKRESSRQKTPTRNQNWFLKGPIPGAWLEAAALLPGKALRVGLTIWHASDVTNETPVKLTHRFLDRFQVGRGATRRGLRELELAGLVKVERKNGRAPLVSLLDVERPQVGGDKPK